MYAQYVRKPWLVLGVGVAVVIVTVIAITAGASPKALPGGRWGRMIACLENDDSLAITAGDSVRPTSPGGHTTRLDVTESESGSSLAVVQKTNSPADARTIVSRNGLGARTNDYDTYGTIVWALTDGNDPQLIAKLDYDKINECIERA